MINSFIDLGIICYVFNRFALMVRRLRQGGVGGLAPERMHSYV